MCQFGCLKGSAWWKQETNKNHIFTGGFYTFPAGQLRSQLAPFIEFIDQISTNAFPCSVSSPTFMYPHLYLGQKHLCRQWMTAKLPQLGTKRAISTSDSFLKTPDYYHFVSYYGASKLLWITELLCYPNFYPREKTQGNVKSWVWINLCSTCELLLS